MLFVIFIPSTFTHFILTFLRIDHDKKINIGNYIITFIIGATVYTPLYAKDMGAFLVFPFWLKPGPFFHLHLLHFVGNVIYSHFLMLRVIKHRSGILRNQVFYVFIGTAIGYTAGVFNYFPWYRIPIPPFLNPLVSISAAFVSYAIIKHHLMGVKLARQYLAMNFFYDVVASAIFIALAFFLRQWFLGISVIIFLAILLGPYLHRRMTKFLEPAFLGETYRTWQELAKFWEKERVVYTAGQLAEILREIPQIMGLESFSFFLFESDRKVFVPEAYAGLDGIFNPDPEQAKVLNTLYPGNPLVMYLEKEKRIITRDELVTQSKDDHQAVLLETDELKALVSVPLFVAGRLTGILNLGTKKTQEMYHQQDMELIKQVLRFAERHLSHISFFDSSLIFSGSVAHDIRKPFRQGIIYGCLDDLQKGPLNPTQKEALDNLKERLVSLDDMSEDMVGAFKNLELFLKSGFKPQKIDYTHLINEESKSFKPMAEERKLTLEIDLPKTEFFLYADPVSVQRILNELLTNAIKYTEQGKITVKVSCENPQEILTEVSDTGCGIAKEDQEEIWELFKRGKNGQTKEGEGIGLAMVRQLVEANAGKIWIDSERGKGSSFFFTLPAWEDKKVR